MSEYTDKLRAAAKTADEEYKEAMRIERTLEREGRRAREAAAIANHKSDMEKEEGMVDHPKADAVYSLAWQYGHSAGFNEVACHYAEFADLVRG